MHADIAPRSPMARTRLARLAAVVGYLVGFPWLAWNAVVMIGQVYTQTLSPCGALIELASLPPVWICAVCLIAMSYIERVEGRPDECGYQWRRKVRGVVQALYLRSHRVRRNSGGRDTAATDELDVRRARIMARYFTEVTIMDRPQRRYKKLSDY